MILILTNSEGYPQSIADRIGHPYIVLIMDDVETRGKHGLEHYGRLYRSFDPSRNRNNYPFQETVAYEQMIYSFKEYILQL